MRPVIGDIWNRTQAIKGLSRANGGTGSTSKSEPLHFIRSDRPQ
jgi:hypothetical protein